jgi:hypothetical protein
MDKTSLIEKLKKGKDSYTHEQLLSWVVALPASLGTKKPKKFKKGDVYLHPIFQHPYILLEKKSDKWVCGLLTSEPNCSEILEPCNSRFFPKETNFFTNVLFTTTSEPDGRFVGVFDNPTQLEKVYKKLKQIFL